MNITELILKHFPNATSNPTQLFSWDAKTKRNRSDCWEKPETLAAFELEAEKGNNKAVITGTSWDDEGNITIGIKKG